MKKFLKFLPVVALLAGIFGVATTKSDTIGADAAQQTLYLDKTQTVEVIGWWVTDETYVHYYTSASGDVEVQMTKISDLLWSYTFPTSVLNSFIAGDGGFRFFVYNRGTAQNEWGWHGGEWYATSNNNFFKMTTTDDTAAQDGDVSFEENPPITSVKHGISRLSCNSSSVFAGWVYDNYDALNSTGKATIQTDLIQVGDVTYFERMTYLVSDAGYTPSGSSVRNVNVNKANYSLVALVSTLSLSALAGFYFLKTKKQ
jgi:hypothetical protein